MQRGRATPGGGEAMTDGDSMKQIRSSAIRIVIRLALGEYLITGPSDNIMELESRVAWATVASELHNEGYYMVTPEEYGAAKGLDPATVGAMIRQDGALFAIAYGAAVLVPLEEREVLGPMPE